MFGVEAHHACEGTRFNLQKFFHVKNCGLWDCVLKEYLFFWLLLSFRNIGFISLFFHLYNLARIDMFFKPNWVLYDLTLLGKHGNKHVIRALRWHDAGNLSFYNAGGGTDIESYVLFKKDGSSGA